MKKAFTTILVMLFAISTFANSYVWYDSTTKKYPRIKERQVMYRLVRPEKCEEIGIVVCSTPKEARAIAAAKEYAAKHGANVIYMHQARDIKGGEVAANKLIGTNIKGKYVLVAVRVSE